MTIEPGDTVEVEYTGRRDDGTVFDTSRESIASKAGLTTSQSDREYDSLTVVVGSGRVLEGLENALVGLEQGTTTTVAVPPDTAGCNCLKISATPGSRNSLQTYSR